MTSTQSPYLHLKDLEDAAREAGDKSLMEHFRALHNLLDAWWALRGALGGMQWSVEAGRLIGAMDDRIKDMDPSLGYDPECAE